MFVIFCILRRKFTSCYFHASPRWFCFTWGHDGLCEESWSGPRCAKPISTRNRKLTPSPCFSNTCLFTWKKEQRIGWCQCFLRKDVKAEFRFKSIHPLITGHILSLELLSYLAHRWWYRSCCIDPLIPWSIPLPGTPTQDLMDETLTLMFMHM